jgi:DNA recombination protein RmuC
MELLPALLGIIAGLAAGLWWGQRKLAESRTENAVLRERLDQREKQSASLETQLQALCAGALHDNSETFLALAASALEKQQQPIHESLERVGAHLREIETKREGAYRGLLAHVEDLLKAQADLRQETARLVGALRSPAQRGRWGEVQLRRVVELAGMVEYCDFIQQPTLPGGEEGALRPDLIIRLPSRRSIIVDAKVPLEAYLAAVESHDDRARAARLREHAEQVRGHLAALSAKSYWSRLPDSPEFVVAFLPGEAFFSAALEHDPSLIEFGVERKVILATPTTLIALLKAVAYGWRQERVAENAQAISDLGRQLYERTLTLRDHLEKLRRSLVGAVTHYNAAVGAVESRVLVAARRLKEMGAAGGAEIEPVEEIDRLPRAAGTPAGGAPVESEAEAARASESTQSVAAPARQLPQ